MYHTIDVDELRSYCRKHIESLEHWARRLIHEQLTNKYGNNYFNAVNTNNEHIINKSIRQQAERLLKASPQRFNRLVDTLFLEDIIYFLCNHNFYKELFKQALDYSYPQGKDEVHEFLKRIIPIRNALCHSNPISIRQAEQVICYCNDFIAGLKEYYTLKGTEKMWNVPCIIKATDSLGNVFLPEGTNYSSQHLDLRDKNDFRIGDTYSVAIEVDPSFANESYNIKWFEYEPYVDREDLYDSLRYSKTFEQCNVAQTFAIYVDIVSKNNWHKFTSYDDRLIIFLTIFPPNV